MSRVRRNDQQAFTLIELLVVIAIIAILAAILMPVFAQARAKARQVSCVSNMRNMSMGIIQYVQDYDEVMPPLQTSTEAFYYTFSPAPPGYDRCWPQLVAPYVKNRDVWKCPSDPNANFGDTHDANGQSTNDPDQIDFSRAIRTDLGFNYAYLCPFNADAKWIGTGLGAIGSPANTIMLVDSIWDRQNGAPQGGGNWYVQAPSVRGSGTVYWFGAWSTDPNSWFRFGGAWPWHASGTQVDVAFVDGHQKSMNVEKLWIGLGAEPWGANPPIADSNAYLWDLN